MPGYAGAYAKISLGEAVRYTNAKQAEAQKEILQRLDHIVKRKDAQADPEILEAFAYFEKEIFSQQTRALVSTVISILGKRCGLENENGEVHLGKPMDQWIKKSTKTIRPVCAKSGTHRMKRQTNSKKLRKKGGGKS